MNSSTVATVVLTVDVVVLRYTASGLQVLFIRRLRPPYQGCWALPGGKLDAQDVSLEAAAVREVQEEAGVELDNLQQVGTFGDIGRDPRGRYVSVLYMATVAPNVFGRPGSDASGLGWFPLLEIPLPLAFDHARLITTARERL